MVKALILGYRGPSGGRGRTVACQVRGGPAPGTRQKRRATKHSPPTQPISHPSSASEDRGVNFLHGSPERSETGRARRRGG